MEHSSLKLNEPRGDNVELNSVSFEEFVSARAQEGPQKSGPPIRTTPTEISPKSLKAMLSQDKVFC